MRPDEPPGPLQLPRPNGSPAWVFWWVRVRAWRASARELLQAPVKLWVMMVVWSALLGLVYLLASRGIRFIYDTAGLGPFLMSRLWFLFLFIVVIMLVVSQMTSAYSTMIRSPETRAWMLMPVSARTLCRIKWVESSVYSAWAVTVLVLPICLAYLVVAQKPLWIVGYVAVGLLVPLIGIVTALSTMLLLLWLRWVGRFVIRRELIPLAFVLACGATFWALGERHREGEQEIWFLALQEMLPRMRIAMAAWLPSSWVATALDAELSGRTIEGALYAGLLWSTLLVCWRLLDHLAAGILLPVLRQHAHPAGLSGSFPHGSSGSQGTAQGAVLPAGLMGGVWRHPWVAALVKDILLVARDPMQWSQAVMFFGLLGAYFSNIHRVAQLSVEPSWRVGVASLNLACTLLVLGSLSVRFIFPQMSLEGRNLWLLRMAPGGMRQLLFAKWCLYAAIAVVIIEGLLWISAGRLGVPLAIRWWLAVVGFIAALTIVSLSVGLGAVWIDPHAQDAARVVSSSNGALVLVLMLAYVGCVVAALVTVWTGWLRASMGWLSAAASLALAGLSVLLGGVALRRGLHRLDRLEWSA